MSIDTQHTDLTAEERQKQVLALLQEAPNHSGALAAQLGLSGSRVRQILDKLLASGQIEVAGITSSPRGRPPRIFKSI